MDEDDMIGIEADAECLLARLYRLASGCDDEGVALAARAGADALASVLDALVRVETD